jgi:hypothetical protein
MKRIIAVAAGLLAITLMHVNPAIAASSGEYSHVNVVQADSDNFLYINVAPPVCPTETTAANRTSLSPSSNCTTPGPRLR